MLDSLGRTVHGPCMRTDQDDTATPLAARDDALAHRPRAVDPTRVRSRGCLAIAVSAALLCVAACTDDSSDSTETTVTVASTTTAAPSTTDAAPTTTGASSAPSSSAAPGTTVAAGGRIGDVPGLDAAAVAIMNKPPYSQGQWAISVRDLETGETVISYNDTTLFPAGSVTKTYSSGAAWLQFGPDSTVVTPVKRIGEVADGTLTGNLVLVGQGDLTMGGRTKPDGTIDFANLDHNDANAIPGATLTPEDPLTGLNDLAAQVKAAGISTVSGDVIIDNRLWGPHRLENGPVTPIIINNNVLDFTITPGAEGQPATAEMRPQIAPWTVRSEVQTVAAGQPKDITVSSPEDGVVVLSGTLAADAGPVVNIYAVPDPATFARTAFIEALGRAGVTVSADPVATNPDAQLPPTADVQAAPTVAQLTSLPLAEELTYVLKVSYNLGAETMICRLAVVAGSTECADGMVKAAAIWRAAGMDTTTASLIDGSGLTGNLITAANQVQLETIMAKRPDADRWKATLPILGVDGSLALVSPGGPAAGKVAAKTGTLFGGDTFNLRYRIATKALGGYIDTKSGRKFAFAIISTDSTFPDIDGVFAANDDVGNVAASIQQTN